jgi:hypothetical protein
VADAVSADDQLQRSPFPEPDRPRDHEGRWPGRIAARTGDALSRMAAALQAAPVAAVVVV